MTEYINETMVRQLADLQANKNPNFSTTVRANEVVRFIKNHY
jgi:hypothetical protein